MTSNLISSDPDLTYEQERALKEGAEERERVAQFYPGRSDQLPARVADC